MDEVIISRCQDILGHQFQNPQLLWQALTHASAAATRGASNERMEFLGDAVLGLVICERIYTSHPSFQEGEMTKIKSNVVSRNTCAKVTREAGLMEMLSLGKGVGSSTALPSSLAACTLEALIGAVYLDGGLEPARRFIVAQMDKYIEAAAKCQHQKNFKSLLQQYAQREIGCTPQYDVLDEKGPEHAKCFEVAVRLGKRQFPTAWGNCKRLAEQKAALVALRELGVLDDTEVHFDEEAEYGQ